MNPIGHCRLCQNHSELQNSHLLPSAAHKATKDNGRNVLAINRKGWANTKNQKDFTEYLLCFDCEQRLSIFEGVAIKSCRTAFNVLDGHPHLNYKLPENSIEYLLKFAYSVFWRASVASLFEDYSLGSDIEQELKDGFYDGCFPKQLHLPISMSFLQMRGVSQSNRILHTPWIQQYSAGLKISYFSMFGIIFRLHFPDALYEINESEFLRADEKSGIVYPLYLWEEDGINEMFAASVDFSKRVARLNMRKF